MSSPDELLLYNENVVPVVFFYITTRMTFPLYKKERERRSRAFPFDSNTV